MVNANLSIKYAKAFFNLYGAQLELADFWLIKKAATILAKNRAVLDLFNLHSEVEQLNLNRVFLKYFKLPESFSKLLTMLQKHKRTFLLPDILSEISELCLSYNRQLFFKLTAYPALSEVEIGQVIDYLEKNTNKQILYEYYQDQNLIAGFKMQSRQFLYEDTIKCRLQKIHRKLVRQN